MPTITLPGDGDVPYGATLRTAINAINTAVDGIEAGWVAYTPTLTNLTVGTGTLTARYKQVGKTVIVNFRFLLGGTSAVGLVPQFTLPVTAASSNSVQGFGYFVDAGTALVEAKITGNTTAATIQCGFVVGSFVTHGNVSATTPFTWVSGDSMAITLVYEAA